ncbi:TPA_asm: DUF5011 domain-containing protein [Salmonella enterica subsp. enterica serovar Abortusovis]|uniref:DUF5011 domain-containing protein n=1 Tax=Salmonella enterica subsp. enterica serovar Abortusovis TaxID=53961 RepID=A0A738DW96_SALET|nr:DUF5011 domain-containing protein [Salmonella enterica subsp. enterica serovar Abortusovis]
MPVSVTGVNISKTGTYTILITVSRSVAPKQLHFLLFTVASLREDFHLQ